MGSVGREQNRNGTNDDVTNFAQMVFDMWGSRDGNRSSDVQDVYTDALRRQIEAPEYQEVSNFLFEQGRGLGVAESLTKEQETMLNRIDRLAVPTIADITTYRTDSVAWLANAHVGDRVPIKNILMSSTKQNVVIPENVGQVAQTMQIDMPMGTRVFAPSNGGERELDAVRGQSIEILSKSIDKKGVLHVKVRVVR